MQAEIKIIPQKKLIGKRLTMSFANNRTAELWRSFMPRRISTVFKHLILRRQAVISLDFFLGTTFSALRQ